MALDTDIFGTPKDSPRDADIFKDAAPVAESAPTMEAAPVKSERQAIIEKAKMGGWGTGLPKVSYAAGEKVAETTGSPLLGAAVSVVPDAIQMAVGGATGTAVGKAASPVTEWLSRFLMSSAMKPTLEQVKRGRAAPAVQTMLDEGFNPTAGGVEGMKGLIGDLGSNVKQNIANSGATVDSRVVADYVPEAYRKFANGPLAVQAIDDLGKVQSGFINHPNIAGMRDIPIQVAQDMKTGYQKAVGDKAYGLMKDASTEGEKQIARGLREEIAKAVPSVAPLLARESNLINALKIAERRVAVDANKNPVGLGWLGQPWMVPFWLWDRSAIGKSLAARALYSGQENIPAALGGGAGILSSIQDKQ